jgi:hypothetical protein
MRVDGLAPRIALIHALAHSVAPINHAFARDWPQAGRMNLLDDSLSADRPPAGTGWTMPCINVFRCWRATRSITERRQSCLPARRLAHASSSGGRLAPLPVLKPNEAMIADALALGARRIGLVASFAPTLESMPAEFLSVRRW